MTALTGKKNYVSPPPKTLITLQNFHEIGLKDTVNTL